MFVLTLKTGLKKPARTLTVVVFAVILALSMLYIFSEQQPSYAECKSLGKYSLSFSTEDERKEFLKTFGATGKQVACDKVRIPMDFNRVYNAYNKLQQKIGLDLDSYRGKTVIRYVYKIDKDYYASVLSYRGKAVACHKSKEIYGGVCMSMVSKND